MKRVPIKWAEAIAARIAADAVVVLAFKDGTFAATSYGATKAKCAAMGKWIDELADRWTNGDLPPPRLEN